MLLGFLLVMNVMAPMRDGVKLATDVYLPEKEGKYPVLLYRTPYNKDGQKGAAAYFNKFGYAVVVQDCRGRFKSEGEFYPFVNEGKDGYDTIEWAAAQPWSNGKVGTIGGSYLAWDQYHAAMYKPPHLVAMFAAVGGANLLNEYGHPGGTPNPGWPMWILNSAMSSPAAQRDPDGRAALASAAKNPREWLALHPRERSKVFAPFPDHKKIYDDMYAHTELDSYWKQRGFYTAGYFGEMKDVPVLFLSGWYDYFGDGLLDTYMALSKRQRTMKRLVMGPWPHGVGAATCGDGNFGERAALDAQALAVDWFDHWMKGDPLEPVNAHPVRYFRMGGGDGGRDEKGRLQHGGAWLTAPAWPLPNARGEKFYLRQGGALAKQPAKGAPASFVFDPEDPVPTIGGRYAGAGTPGCFQDQICKPGIPGCKAALPLVKRADVLSYATEPLAENVEVTGKIRATLWISSEAPDTDFTAKLVDVYPDGYSAIIADGQIRTRYRNGQDRSQLMQPGRVYQVSIDMNSASNLFGKGHRIRLDVSSSNYPKFEPNPNTGEPAGAWTRRVKPKNTVYLDEKRPSHVELPVVR